MKSILSQIDGIDLTKFNFEEGQKFEIVLHQKEEIKSENTEVAESEKTGEVRITVKKYMTEPASPSFDFMSTWNNNTPMPLVTMTGTIDKETRGMYHMNLHGEIMQTSYCMCCGRELHNPISRLYGMGPECGGHWYVNPFSSEEEYEQYKEELKKKVRDIKWTGWVIKSAIKSMEDV